MDCSTCKHEDVGLLEEPCNSCFSNSHWEEEGKQSPSKACIDCMHVSVFYQDMPCRDCYFNSEKPNFKPLPAGEIAIEDRVSEVERDVEEEPEEETPNDIMGKIAALYNEFVFSRTFSDNSGSIDIRDITVAVIDDMKHFKTACDLLYSYALLDSQVDFTLPEICIHIDHDGCAKLGD